MTLTSWTEAEMKLNVSVNGALLPFTKTPDMMQRYIRPALFSTGHDLYELQYFGSALLAKYRGWTFALATAHQVNMQRGAPSAESFVLVVENEGAALAVPPTAIHEPQIADEDFKSLNDLVFFDYSERAALLKPLNLADVYWPNEVKYMTIDYSFVLGFPASSVDIVIDDDDETGMPKTTYKWIRQDLLPATSPELLDVENRRMFVKHPRSTRESIDPNGLSGSPVFSIVADRSLNRHLQFEGILTNARGDRFAVYPSTMIKTLLDTIVDANRD